jgi:hypothetical protein
MGGLIKIPYADIRNGTPVDLLETYATQARALTEACRDTFGLASRLASSAVLPLTDRASLNWLMRSNNPYLAEIRQFAEFLKVRGIYTLNICYEWGCTSSARETSGGMVLHRVLDWAFPKLGEHLVVSHQAGRAGDFYNVTWPGLSGLYQAMAPGRFAAAINQAPMRSYAMGTAGDWTRNRIAMRRQLGLPPAHLLRRVFETAPDFGQAVDMLCREAIAIPAIFVVTGTKPGEGSVIERTEREVGLRRLVNGRVCAANHFETQLNDQGRGWLPRSHDSPERAKCAASLQAIGPGFSWFVPPVANPKSRLALIASASTGELNVMGTAGARPVTETFSLPRAA